MPPSIGAIANTRLFRETHANYAKVNLYNVMTAFRGFEASDARDMVFALVGMVDDRNDPVLVPDYRLQVEEVFLSVTFLMLKRYGLDIPYDAGRVQRSYPSMPSWVVDWTIRPRTTSFYAPPMPCHYHAAGEMSPVLRSPEYSNPLILDGVFIDHVKSFTPPLHVHDMSHDLNEGLLNGLANYYFSACSLANSLSTNQINTLAPSMETRFWRTLAANRTYDGLPAPTNYASGHDSVRDYLSLWNTCGRSTETLTAHPSAKDLHAAYKTSWFLPDFYRYSFHRRFCLTDHGRMGLLPEDKGSGDRAVLLLGKDLPVVMRAAEYEGRAAWRLTGDCFVGRLMDGERLRVGDGDVKIEEAVIH
ncbi:MAG: hypothetical protein Q9164_002649 [Protoblastenia rupestris]